MTHDDNCENTWLATPVARHIWETKYRWLKGGKAPEAGIEETWQRVARTAAAAEPAEQDHWEAAFYEVLRGFRFLPGGRILAGAGTERRITLFNCFVMGLIEDDMESIFEALKEGALTMQAAAWATTFPPCVQGTAWPGQPAASLLARYPSCISGTPCALRCCPPVHAVAP
jgi:ribonucleotide reductase alpha subunit